MSFKIVLDHEHKLVRYTHVGHIPKEAVGEAWDQFLKLPEFTEQRYNLFSDYRGATFKANLKDVYAIVDILSNIGDVIRGKKQALVLHDPVSTALSLVFTSLVYARTGFHVKVFSTEEAALKWLLKGS